MLTEVFGRGVLSARVEHPLLVRFHPGFVRSVVADVTVPDAVDPTHVPYHLLRLHVDSLAVLLGAGLERDVDDHEVTVAVNRISVREKRVSVPLDTKVADDCC